MKKLKRYRRLLIAGAGILLVLLVLIFGFRGCGVSHKSPEGVVKSLIKAYGKGSQSKIRSCYGVKKADEDLQKEIDATISYIEAHNTKEVEIEECDVLSENKDYTYVYITYHLIQEDKQEYPCISTYMTEKKDGKYYVISTANVTDGQQIPHPNAKLRLLIKRLGGNFFTFKGDNNIRVTFNS